MSQPETDDESRSRALEELKGKNIAHYSVLLTAFIQTKMEHDKTLVTLSAGGIGLLLTLLNLTGSGSTVSLVLFGGSFLGFLLTIGCALVIYERNASHIENELRGGAPKDFKLDLLDRSLKWSFMFAVLCAILAGTVSMWSTQMAASTKSTQDTKAFQRSLKGIENLKPPATTGQTPVIESPTPQGSEKSEPATESPASDKSKTK